MILGNVSGSPIYVRIEDDGDILISIASIPGYEKLTPNAGIELEVIQVIRKKKNK